MPLTDLPVERTAALWQYQTAAAAAPSSSDVFHQLGAALRGHDEPRAARAFGRALALSPLHAPSFLALGQALLADGRPNDATRCLRRALCLQPDLEAAAVQLAALKPPAPDSDGDESPEQLAAGVEEVALVVLQRRQEAMRHRQIWWWKRGL